MQSEKCIHIKKKLVDYMRERFPDFIFEGGNSHFTRFAEKTLMEFMTISLYSENFLREFFLLLLQKLPHAIINHGKGFRGLLLVIVQISVFSLLGNSTSTQISDGTDVKMARMSCKRF